MSDTLSTRRERFRYKSKRQNLANLSNLPVMPHFPIEIEYSPKYYDDTYEYRHVMLPKELYKKMPKGILLSEPEWRALGLQQSRGWVHYDIHKPEPHVLLFRRPRTEGNLAVQPPGFGLSMLGPMKF